jgi:hypothetical protein
MTKPTTPPLDPGFVFVENPDRRAMQRLVLGADCDGETLGSTPGYWHRGWWQTTIPYWVELCGAVDATDPVEAVQPPAEVAATD